MLWRGTGNLFEAVLDDPLNPGDPLNLAQRRVTMIIVDRVGAAEVKFEQTNEPGGGHTDEANGVTRFFVPASPTFDDLTLQRSYTWKYQVYVEYIPSGVKNMYFYGDVRVQAPPRSLTV